MKFFRNNGLTIVLCAAFGFSLIGMIFSGWYQENLNLARHMQPALSLTDYLSDESFLSALFENWESEWLQMATYVGFTAFLFQKGSAESRDPEAGSSNSPKDKTKDKKPQSFRRWCYKYSLGLALSLLFLFSFIAHLIASCEAFNSEAIAHGEPIRSIIEHLGSAHFWFESFQNWQSEFFSTATLVVLSIFLRFKGSPESKKVDAANSETGG
jgi:hypothetical protein